MKTIGNFGAMISAICLFLALFSARHDFQNHLMHNNQPALAEAASSIGSFDTGNATLSMK